MRLTRTVYFMDRDADVGCLDLSRTGDIVADDTAVVHPSKEHARNGLTP